MTTIFKVPHMSNGRPFRGLLEELLRCKSEPLPNGPFADRSGRFSVGPYILTFVRPPDSQHFHYEVEVPDEHELWFMINVPEAGVLT